MFSLDILLLILVSLARNIRGNDDEIVHSLPENKKVENSEDCRKINENMIGLELNGSRTMLNVKIDEENKENKICINKNANLITSDDGKLILDNDGRLILGNNATFSLHGSLTLRGQLNVYGELTISKGAQIYLKTGYQDGIDGLIYGRLIFGENSRCWCYGEFDVLPGGRVTFGNNSKLDMLSNAKFRVSSASYGIEEMTISKPELRKEAIVDVDNGRIELWKRAYFEVNNGGSVNIKNGELHLWYSTELIVDGAMEINDSEVKFNGGKIHLGTGSKLWVTADQGTYTIRSGIVLKAYSGLLIAVKDARLPYSDIIVEQWTFCRVKPNEYRPEKHDPIQLTSSTYNEVFSCYGTESEMMAASV